MKLTRETVKSLVAIAIVVAVIVLAVVVLLSGDDPKPPVPKVLPTEFPRETVQLPEQRDADDLASYPPGAVVARVQAFDESCWFGTVNETRVKGCGAKEYVVTGPPATTNLYVVTLRKKEVDRNPLILELLINDQVVDSAETKKPLGLVAVSGN